MRQIYLITNLVVFLGVFCLTSPAEALLGGVSEDMGQVSISHAIPVSTELQATAEEDEIEQNDSFGELYEIDYDSSLTLEQTMREFDILKTVLLEKMGLSETQLTGTALGELLNGVLSVPQSEQRVLKSIKGRPGRRRIDYTVENPTQYILQIHSSIVAQDDWVTGYKLNHIEGGVREETEGEVLEFKEQTGIYVDLDDDDLISTAKFWTNRGAPKNFEEVVQKVDADFVIVRAGETRNIFSENGTLKDIVQPLTFQFYKRGQVEPIKEIKFSA